MENARKAEAAKSKIYGEYEWEGLIKEEKNLKRLQVHELDKYLIYHRVKGGWKRVKQRNLRSFNWHQIEAATDTGNRAPR